VRKLTADLEKEGFKTVVIVDPAVKVDENYRVYTEGKTQNLFTKNANGSEFQGRVWAGKSAFPDFTNPKTREWFGAQYREFINDGIAGFWNDMNEPSNFPDAQGEPVGMNHPQKTLPIDARENGDGFAGQHNRFHNVYGLQMVRSTFDGVRKLAPEKRPFILTRAGFSGVQRFAAVWTGDNTASWEHLQLSIPMLLNMSVSGMPFVGADVGGYSDMPSGELYARWLQAASLMPFLRSHSENNQPNKEPWEYGAEFEKINRASVEQRYRFLPYLYTLFREHEKTGQPVLRPLWYEYSNDVKTYLIDDQFLVGRDLLIAPVLRPGQRKRQIYFPAGDDWRDFRTGEIYKGGSSAEIDAPLEKLPLFARVGAIIATQDLIQHTGEMPNAAVTLNVVAGISPEKTETTTLFQDAGDGYGYRKNDWREVKIEHRRGLLILNPSGNFAGAQKIRRIEAIGVPQKPREIRIDGKTVKGDYDSKEKRLKIEIDENAKEITLIP
jgi:alpha-glucosidase